MPTHDIYNYRKVNAHLVTGGQPTDEQLRDAAAEGFEAVVNLATEQPGRSLQDEAGLVHSLDMAYYPIPVIWDHSILEDFLRFATVFSRLVETKTLLHYAANFRVTAFYSLYALKHLGWSEGMLKRSGSRCGRAVITRSGSSLFGMSRHDSQRSELKKEAAMLYLVTNRGIFRSEDGDGSWNPANVGPSIKHLRWIDMGDDESSGAFAGTEPASIFHSEDRGQMWHSCPEVAVLRDQFYWSLPYSAYAGCGRGGALHGSRAYNILQLS